MKRRQMLHWPNWKETVHSDARTQTSYKTVHGETRRQKFGISEAELLGLKATRHKTGFSKSPHCLNNPNNCVVKSVTCAVGWGGGSTRYDSRKSNWIMYTEACTESHHQISTYSKCKQRRTAERTKPPKPNIIPLGSTAKLTNEQKWEKRIPRCRPRIADQIQDQGLW